MSKEKSTVKHGVPRPKEGTDAATVFGIADKLGKKGQDRSAVLAACKKAKVNPATAATQYNRWRVYNGIKGRKAKAAA